MADVPHVIGLISDTHGLVRPEVFAALEGVELILHAGDVGDGVLDELATIAPIEAVYGNTDPTDDPRLSQSIERTIEGVRMINPGALHRATPHTAMLLCPATGEIETIVVL